MAKDPKSGSTPKPAPQPLDKLSDFSIGRAEDSFITEVTNTLPPPPPKESDKGGGDGGKS